MKKYKDYGEYLEAAYEERALLQAQKCSEEYIYGNIKLKVTEINGQLEATWERL